MGLGRGIFQLVDLQKKDLRKFILKINLFRSTYQPTFGMLVFSKRLDPLAQTAIAEAIRLDEQGAPQREIERQRMQDEADRAEQEKARLVNKVAFRP